MRPGGMILGLALLASPAMATPPNVIVGAEYSEPTTRYDHAILGDAVEWGALELTVDQCFGCRDKMIRKFVIRLPDTRVFEDTAPRLVEVTGDTSPEVMVVETDIARGARLAIYDETGLVAATPFIGRTHRWLAPIGAADLDGDGQAEIVYVDRPHLAKTIRIWRYRDGNQQLQPVADLPGYTNHRIGDSEISGGIRECGQGPEMVVADTNWTTISAVSFDGEAFSARLLGPVKGADSFRRALSCRAP